MVDTFVVQVDEWVLKTKQRTEAVIKASAQDVIELMQTPVKRGGNMPIDTGFLRASLRVNLTGPVPMANANPYVEANSAPEYNGAVAVAAIAGLDVGKTLWATYGAEYAAHVNYGVNGRVGRQFVGLAAQKWGSIVHKNVVALKATVASNMPVTGAT